MLSIIRKISALPLRLVRNVITIIPGFNIPVGLLAAIWKLGQEEDDALRYQRHFFHLHGYEKGKDLTHKILTFRRWCSIPACAGLVANNEGFPEEAMQWLMLAHECTEGKPDALLLLELETSRDKEEQYVIAQKILARRDVPMPLTRSALWIVILSTLEKQEWQEAANKLDHIFRIEDPPSYRWMRWVAATGLEQHKQAQRYFQEAWSGLPPEVALHYQAFGWFFLNDTEKSRTLLTQALEAGLSPENAKGLCQDLQIDIAEIQPSNGETQS